MSYTVLIKYFALTACFLILFFSLAFNPVDYSFINSIYFVISLFLLLVTITFTLVHQVIPALDSDTPIFASSFTMEVRRYLYNLATLLVKCCFSISSFVTHE